MSETYIDEFKRDIDYVAIEVKAGRLPIEARMKYVEDAVSRYLYKHSEHGEPKRLSAIENGNEPKSMPPNSVLLDRMNYWLLYEDYTDKTAHKSRHSEYPFLSEQQLARRQNGKHGRGGENIGEASFEGAATVASNGRDYRIPTRRKRSEYEHALRNKTAQIRNAERRKRYNEFTKIQPVYTYKMPKY